MRNPLRAAKEGAKDIGRLTRPKEEKGCGLYGNNVRNSSCLQRGQQPSWVGETSDGQAGVPQVPRSSQSPLLCCAKTTRSHPERRVGPSRLFECRPLLSTALSFSVSV